MTDGTCNSIPTQSFQYIFGWVNHASLAEYDEFLSWEVWSHSIVSVIDQRTDMYRMPIVLLLLSTFYEMYTHAYKL